MKRRVTINDVARIAGVSRQTVSRAINNKGEISPTTMERVMRAVEELGYRPSSVARGLATHRTHTIGLVVPDITNPFFPDIARGVQDVARGEEYNVFMCNTDESPEQELRILYSLAAQPVDGIVLCGSRISESELQEFADYYRPLVLLNRWLDKPGVSAVLVDNRLGASLVIRHLIRNGHREIGMLAGPSTSPSSVERVEGFQTAALAYGLPVGENHIVPGAPTLEGGYQAARELLRQHSGITAIFAYNDLIALGAIHCCSDLGRPVPEACSVVGFDDIGLASIVRPSLTTIQVDKYNLGQQAMLRLLAMLVDPTSRFPAIDVDISLVVRESAPG